MLALFSRSCKVSTVASAQAVRLYSCTCVLRSYTQKLLKKTPLSAPSPTTGLQLYVLVVRWLAGCPLQLSATLWHHTDKPITRVRCRFAMCTTLRGHAAVVGSGGNTKYGVVGSRSLARWPRPPHAGRRQLYPLPCGHAHARLHAHVRLHAHTRLHAMRSTHARIRDSGLRAQSAFSRAPAIVGLAASPCAGGPSGTSLVSPERSCIWYSRRSAWLPSNCFLYAFEKTSM